MQTNSSNNIALIETIVVAPATVVKSEVSPAIPLEEMPTWMLKMASRQLSLNKKYERAHGQFTAAYNEFLASIEEINEQHGTDFSFQQAVTEYQGMFADDVPIGADEED